MANGERQAELSELERKTLLLHGLFSHLSLKDAFGLVGLEGSRERVYRWRAQAAKSLKQKRLLDEGERLTSLGWDALAGVVDGATLQAAAGSWHRRMESLGRENDRWRALRILLPEPHAEPEPPRPEISAPDRIRDLCEHYLKLARMSMIVGAWAGAIQSI